MKSHRSSQTAPILAAGTILVLAFLFGALRYPHFATLSNITGLLGDYAFVGIAAIGATLVILSGGIDLSVGAVIAFSSILVATLVALGWHPLVAGGVGLAAGAGAGLVMGLLIQVFELPAFMVTLAGMFAIRALGFVVAPQSVSIDHPMYAAARHAAIPLGADASLTSGAVVFLIVLAAGWLLASRTPLGRCIYAMGGMERSARVMGLPVARTRIAVYTIAGACSALAGFVFTLYKEAGDPASAGGLELDVIASVVIGGTLLSGGVGSIPSTLMGVLILGLIRLIIDFQGDLNAAWTSIATGILLLVFLGVQKAVGSLGARAAARSAR